jgi:hypothetical protein
LSRPAFFTAALFVGTALAAGEVRLQTDGSILASAPAESLQVFVDEPGELPPVAGSVDRTGAGLIFRPKYPLRPGQGYRVEIGEPGGRARTERLRVERTAAPSTRLDAIYPSAAVLPENHLRFYLEFSAPMSRGEAYRRIRLLEADGSAVELPFLELQQELWDREGRWLTLLFDPGRVKRGLVPNIEEGEPIREGRSYRLVVDPAWLDSSGLPLAAGGEKRFSVGPADHASPDPAQWKLTVPHAGTNDPLVVEFGEPLDRRLAERTVSAVDLRRRAIEGKVALSTDESRWTFTPATPWQAGRYLLQVDPALEDLAGNSVARAFETMPGRETGPASTEPVYREFAIE